MADFDDITGWREELEAFRKTDEGYKFFDQAYSSEEKVKLSDIFELAELYIKFDCLHEAIKKKAHWEEYGMDELEDMPGIYDDNFARMHPRKAMETSFSFRDWYAVKKNIRADPFVLNVALIITGAYVLGQINSCRSIDSVSELIGSFSDEIIFDVELPQ